MNSHKFKILLITITILSFLAFLDSTYLTILHYQNTFPPCSITHGCETVQTSQYATIGNIPVALLGSVYYLVLTVFSIICLQFFSSNIINIQNTRKTQSRSYRDQKIRQSETLGVRNSSKLSILSFLKKELLTRYLFFLALAGFIASLVFFSLQAFVIRAFCQYCLLAELLSTLILTLSIVLVRIKNNSSKSKVKS